MPTPFLGMGVVVVIGWYWYGPFGGLRPLTLGLVGFGVVTSVVLVIVNRLEWRCAGREIARRLSTAGIVAAGVAAVLTLSWGALFAGPFATNGAHSNNDMPSYALLGQFVADHGPDEAGPIVGYPLGDRTQSSFDFGVVAVVAAASVGPIGETWRSQMPIMAVAVGLVAFVLARMFELLVRDRRRLAALAGVAGICPMLVALMWSSYYLNEVLAISIVIAVTVAVVQGAAQHGRRTRLAFVVASGVTLAPVVASYPHMALAGPAILLPGLFLACGVRNAVRRVIALGAQCVGTAVVTFVLLPSVIWHVPAIVRYLSRVDAGFALPGFLPAEVLGFVSTIDPRHHGAMQWVPSIAIVAVIAAAAAYVIIRTQASELGRFALVFLFFAFTSYAIVFVSQGPSYRQWKWITFFTPAVTGTAVMVVVVALVALLDGRVRRPERGVFLLGFAYCVVAVSNSGDLGFGVGSRPALILTVDQTTIDASPALEGIAALNIDVSPFWETMWLTYFLRDRAALRLAQPSYYAIAAPAPGWTLQRRDAPTNGAVEVRVVNDTYQLVRR